MNIASKTRLGLASAAAMLALASAALSTPVQAADQKQKAE